jgi:hypothetical protein
VSLSGGGVMRLQEGDKEIVIERGVTPSRWTFIISPEGRVLYKTMNADPETDSRKALEFVRTYNEKRRDRG